MPAKASTSKKSAKKPAKKGSKKSSKKAGTKRQSKGEESKAPKKAKMMTKGSMDHIKKLDPADKKVIGAVVVQLMDRKMTQDPTQRALFRKRIKKAVKKEDKEKIERKPSSYIKWVVTEGRSSLPAGMSFAEQGRALGKMWENMSPEEKENFKEIELPKKATKAKVSKKKSSKKASAAAME